MCHTAWITHQHDHSIHQKNYSKPHINRKYSKNIIKHCLKKQIVKHNINFVRPDIELVLSEIMIQIKGYYFSAHLVFISCCDAW